VTIPYQINRATYAVAPYFIWQKLKPEPVYRHRQIREFYVGLEGDVFRRIRSVRGFVIEVCRKIGIGGAFFFAAALLPPFIMLPWAVMDRRIRGLLIIGAAASVGVVVNAFYSPRYSSPVTALLYALMLQCMRHLFAVSVNRDSAGKVLVRIIPVLCVLMAGVRLAAEPLHVRYAASPSLWYGPGALGLPRARVASKFERRPGKHLLIVRYGPRHFCYDEWVYNAADIDGAKVVWARDMEAARNRKLIEYFKDRQVWLVEPDMNPPVVTPYFQAEEIAGPLRVFADKSPQR
jgi:hypothetical protein